MHDESSSFREKLAFADFIYGMAARRSISSALKMGLGF
jgi:hypothetical protein